MLLKMLGRRAAADVEARLGADNIVLVDESANCFGIESKGVKQIRGNGCLALSGTELLFIMWLPHKEFLIARNRITSVERARWHLGKTKGHELLKVLFTNDEGRPDSAAWLVRDLSAWETALSPQSRLDRP